MGASDWKDLKAKQKQKLSEVMFGVVCAHYKEHGQMPAGAELEKLAKAAFTKIQGRGLGLSYETVHDVFLKKRARIDHPCPLFNARIGRKYLISRKSDRS